MIERIEVVNGAIPLTKTVPEQQWTEEWGSQLYVKVVAGGVTGWGEVLPAGGNSREPYAAIINRFRDELIGLDEDEIQACWTRMRRITFSGGYGITTGAISGIDIALWDVAGKKKGAPISRLLRAEGGDGVGSGIRLKRYASMSRYRTTEEAVQAVGWLLDRGYRSIKLHQSRKDALETIRLVRERYGDGFELSADLNCAFGLREGEEFMKQVRRYGLAWVEEPIWPPDDFDSLKRLNALGPVAAGENAFSFFEFKRLVETHALTYYQPDITKIGGITPAVELMGLTNAHDARVAFHNRPNNGWVGAVASAHVASALAPRATIETTTNEIPERTFSFAGSVDTEGISVAGPGLGIAPLDSIPRSSYSKVLRFHEP